MTKISYVISDDTTTVFVDGKCHTIHDSHPNFKLLINELIGLKRLTHIQKLITIPDSIKKFMKGSINVNLNLEKIFYKNLELEPVITKKIISAIENGDNFRPYLKFVDNLYRNPSRDSIRELYKFLVHEGLTLMKDGCFVAYKGVNSNYKDCRTGKFSNKSNKKHTMKRKDVDNNRDVACGQGFHVANYRFAKSFAPTDGHVMLIKINPKDVVSVPLDSNAEKCRVCSYYVIKEWKEDRPITQEETFKLRIK